MNPATTEDYEGSLMVQERGDKVFVLYEMIFNVRLCMGKRGDVYGYDRGWCYPKTSQGIAEAMTACAEWDGEAVPPGDWIKEVGT